MMDGGDELESVRMMRALSVKEQVENSITRTESSAHRLHKTVQRTKESDRSKSSCELF